ncbi:MAG: sugar phosphate nucleotidyltransferase [Nitrospinales bacterium]
MRAMVLAAGYGVRLRPLTETLPKPMVPVMNRPILEHTLALLRANGIHDVIANLHHLPEKVTAHFGDGAPFGVRLHYSLEETLLGAAGGIKAAQPFLEAAEDGGSFLVINGDILTNIDLRRVAEFHKRKGAVLTLVLRRAAHPEQFEHIETGPDGRITHFPGVADAPLSENTMMFTGIQIMSPEILARIPSTGFCGTTETVFPEMIRRGLPVYGYAHTGYWLDVGQRQSYLQAHRDILEGKIAVDAGAGSQNSENPAVTPPVFLGNSCRISENARVGPCAVLGDHCEVQDGAVVEHSVCWERAVIGRNAVIRQSIIGAGVHVTANATVIDRSISGDAEP